VKKAQGGLNAAILIAVIAGLIMAYIIFLPEDEREALLENKTIDKIRNGNGIFDSENILLREFPGRIDTVEEVDDKQLPNVYLFETTNAKELAQFNSFLVRNGWFDKKSKVVSFSLADVPNTDNVLLTFQALKHEGVLAVALNSEVVFEQAMGSAVADPVRLPKSLLQEENKLEFSVSTVGAKFWSTNEYSLENIKLIADVTDKSKQESSTVFTLTDTELYNTEETNLRFTPYCSAADAVGTLDISINSKNVFSGIPVCEDVYKQPIPIASLKAGQNEIKMKTSKGSYSVEQIKIEFDEEDIKTKVYFFEINDSSFKRIKNDKEKLFLNMEFVNDKEQKRADININDKFITLDQDEKAFSEDITEKVKQGNNFVEIKPRSLLDIVEIAVLFKED